MSLVMTNKVQSKKWNKTEDSKCLK